MSAVGMESSKVTVEYHDPSGIFPLISRDIHARLPLRNLNWQSPPRPLRQIRSLHVEFVPDKSTLLNLNSSSSSVDKNAPNSLDIVRGNAEQRNNAVKERRHQIPGFRTSPYLKIFVLRCDDKEAYKEHDRRKIREWVKEHVNIEGKREDHDAFEWMILHVVIPNTIAAGEPRWRENAKDPDELRERKSGVKLLSKNTRTVFDRLRADFNESSKVGHDRVTQIRLLTDLVPSDLLPTPALAETHEETAQERENAWNDLITKLKNFILGPFDRRVRQYEADIAEQESRRSLPGWNFCTFFIHKEGLAKALESIGLTEDALAIYDELWIALETTLREIASGQAQATATSFAAHTVDFERRILGLSDERMNGMGETTNEIRDTALLFSQDYRDRIARSDISVFDFVCYYFSRQKALILRLANARSVRIHLGADASKEGGEDLVLTSEVCWRASTFIHNAARTLRQDLIQGQMAMHLGSHAANADNSKSTPKTSRQLEVKIESLVCSWVWEITGQVLEETTVPALTDVTEHGKLEPLRGRQGTLKGSQMSIGLGANTHPQRTTSLPGHPPNGFGTRHSPSRPRTQDMSNRPTSSGGLDPLKVAGLPGQAELATYRAELISMRRKMLEQLARRRNWFAGWVPAQQWRYDALEHIDLNGESDEVGSAKDSVSLALQQILSRSLKSALGTKSDFQKNYETLTEAAIRHYFAATQSKTAESFLGDLALLKYQQGHYEEAIPYFEHILPLLATESWDLMELLALSMYARCLKQLGQLPEYTQNTLTVLGKVVARHTSQELAHGRFDENSWLGQGDKSFDHSGLFAEVINTSSSLQDYVTSSLEGIFPNVHLSQHVEHDATSDAFALSLRFRHLLGDKIELTAISVVLIAYEDPSQQFELACNGPIPVNPGGNEVKVVSKTVTYGPFLIGSITFTAKQLRFVKEFQPHITHSTPDLTNLELTHTSSRKPEPPPKFIFVYAAEEAFCAEVKRSPNIQVDKPQHLVVYINSWRNQIDSIVVRIKPASAGLRLHLADSVVKGVEVAEAHSTTGQLSFGELAPYRDATVVVPYTIEHACENISVRLDILYRVANVEYTYLRAARLSNELPLDVAVNDIFRLDAVVSNFTIRTMTKTPLAVLEAHLDESPIYAIEAPTARPLPLNVYRSQPINLVYKIARKHEIRTAVLKRDAALALRVLYQPTDEIILSGLKQEFTKGLEESQFGSLRRLLTSFLLERAQSFIRGLDLELVLLMGECRSPGFDFIGWEELIRNLSEAEQEPLRAWLRQWHIDHPNLPVVNRAIGDTSTQQITTSVDVPNVDMVFSTSLKLSTSPLITSNSRPVVLGQPLRADVRIQNTANWSAKSIFPNVPTLKIDGEDGGGSSFVCEIGTDSDVWAIGGPRRHHFTPQEGHDHLLNITLLPLQLGTHRLPLVQVHRGSTNPEATYDSTDASSFTCECHCESAGEMVHVFRDARITKVHIEESPHLTTLPGSRPGTASSSAFG